MSAEYLLYSGTEKLILCERGIRTFEHTTHNTLDLSAVPVLRSLTHLPIIVDPCHLGIRDKIPPMALASVASGADGIIVSIHPHPDKALCDGQQSMFFEQFNKMMHDIEALSPVMGKSVSHIRNESTQPSLRCAYSGKRGAYAEQAITRYFDGAQVQSIPFDSFTDIFQAVTDGRVDYGMVPIENSLAGSVYQNYDNFSRFEDVSIVGAITLNIRHALLGVKGATLADVRTVYSHPQAMSQSKKFLDGHKDWIQVDAVSTASAASLVASKGSAENAAIASPVNAQLYGLSVLAQDIEDDPGNFTRFVVIKANHVKERAQATRNPIAPNMASLIFSTRNEVGALYNVLGVFEREALNLTRLESRPIEGQPWRYWFYADVSLEGKENLADECVQDLLDKLKDKTEYVRLLGIYSEYRRETAQNR